jgi:hypothetical protein
MEGAMLDLFNSVKTIYLVYRWSMDCVYCSHKYHFSIMCVKVPDIQRYFSVTCKISVWSRIPFP